MRKVWVVVANGSQAKIYTNDNSNKLTLKCCLEHPESHLKDSDLVSDAPGINAGAIAGSHAYETKIHAKVKEKLHFAEQIACYLEESLKNQEFERLYLVANPNFLGHLRECFPAHVSQTIFAEVDKDLTHCSQEEVRDYLPPVL